MNRVARLTLGWGLAWWLGLGGAPVAAQATDELESAVEQLGDFDHAVRVEASRVLRRAAPEQAIPVLLDAARAHPDSYVQFRAVILAYGFDALRARPVFEDGLDSANDRVRATAYEYFEQFPSSTVVPRLLTALDTETSEFVRPYLVRALAANDETAEVQEALVRDVDRGEGYFRGAVIEALGDYEAEYAVGPLLRVASDAGPLRDDALLALGKIGDPRAVPALGRIQADADEDLQPIVSATACLLEVDCDGQLRYVVDALSYAAQAGGDDGQRLLRGASTALAALAMTGHRAALEALFAAGAAASESARAPVAIALGTVAFRNPTVVRNALRDRAASGVPEAELLLLRDAFDMLDEDFAEERFYVMLRGDYWDATDQSADRRLADAAIHILEF